MEHTLQGHHALPADNNVMYQRTDMGQRHLLQNIYTREGDTWRATGIDVPEY